MVLSRTLIFVYWRETKFFYDWDDIYNSQWKSIIINFDLRIEILFIFGKVFLFITIIDYNLFCLKNKFSLDLTQNFKIRMIYHH